MHGRPGRRIATALAPAPCTPRNGDGFHQPTGAADAAPQQAPSIAMTTDSDHGDQLSWTVMGVRMGFTSEQPQRAEILAAIDRMSWIEPSAQLPGPEGAAARAVINAVIYRHPHRLQRIGVAGLGGERRLIGLDDTAGVGSYVLDLGAEAIHVLTISGNASLAATSSSARQCDAIAATR